MLVKINDNSFYDTNFNSQSVEDEYSDLRSGLHACWSGISFTMYDCTVSISNEVIDGVVRVVTTVSDGTTWTGMSTEMVDNMVEYSTHSDIGSHVRMMNVYNMELVPWYGPSTSNVVYMF